MPMTSPPSTMGASGIVGYRLREWCRQSAWVSGPAHDRARSARVEAPDQVYQSVFDYPSMTEAQAWVEQKIETLLSTPRSTP